MKALFLLPLLVGLFVAPVQAGPLKEAQASYVQITDVTGEHHCGATKIGEYTVVTADHCTTVPILVQGQTPVHIERDGHEHAFLFVGKPLKGKKVRMAVRFPQIEEKLYVWGMPLGLGPIWREGIFMGTIESSDPEVPLWRMASFQVAGGDSGSGIFDAKGRLVGSVSINLNPSPFPAWGPGGWYEYKFTVEQWKMVK